MGTQRFPPGDREPGYYRGSHLHGRILLHSATRGSTNADLAEGNCPGRTWTICLAVICGRRLHISNARCRGVAANGTAGLVRMVASRDLVAAELRSERV